MLQDNDGGSVSMDADPIQLSAQLAVLDSQLDTRTLAGASEPVRSALTDAGDDAGSLAQAYANPLRSSITVPVTIDVGSDGDRHRDRDLGRRRP